MNPIRTFSRAAGAVGVAGALILVATPASAADTATVSVLHAVPDTPVDVYANGERLIDDFQPGTLTDPLELPAGSYDLALFPPTQPTGRAPRCCRPTASPCPPEPTPRSSRT